MKRKSDSITSNGSVKSSSSKKAKATKPVVNHEPSFRDGLLQENILKGYSKEYAESGPYKHAVIENLMNDTLLRKVRDEIKENVQFTPKETDIYKIHQSGDLANLDGLDDAALSKLPSLLKLRDALYSPEFRKYVAEITGSGEVSGRKTDMAINVYTPGCHLLCHDDVIGSRRISYILYLTDPDIPWKQEWGGALRLYPTKTFTEEDGEITRTPTPGFTKVIPPAWNQLSFFAVQPGESFHDVEEVYHAATREQQEKDGGRIRMAISGWFHIPQIGEDGYVEGAEERLAEKSSLAQLQGRPDHYDFPKEQVTDVKPSGRPFEEKALDEADIDFLLKFMSPTYLTPDTMEQVTEHFEEQSSVTVDNLLSKKFSARVRAYIEAQETKSLLSDSNETDKSTSWEIARPPHKHRFLYAQPSSGTDDSTDPSPMDELLNVFLPSPQFRLWLELASACEINSFSLMARRFRRGLDYSLATSHEGSPRLEVSLSLTPSKGWGFDEEEEEEEEEEEKPRGKGKSKAKAKENGKSKTNGKAKAMQPVAEPEEETEPDDVGGHEVYMAGDDDGADTDAAIYKTSSGDDGDDNVLFTVSPTWNTLSIVLRDSGVLKFTKYVSRKAEGDRWDVVGLFGVLDEDEDEDDDQQDGEKKDSQVSLESSGEEEEFNGFPESEDSDSD